jgi:hypothetical protein
VLCSPLMKRRTESRGQGDGAVRTQPASDSPALKPILLDPSREHGSNSKGLVHCRNQSNSSFSVRISRSVSAFPWVVVTGEGLSNIERSGGLHEGHRHRLTTVVAHELESVSLDAVRELSIHGVVQCHQPVRGPCLRPT